MQYEWNIVLMKDIFLIYVTSEQWPQFGHPGYWIKHSCGGYKLRHYNHCSKCNRVAPNHLIMQLKLLNNNEN